MAKRVIYQIDPKRRNADGSFPDFVFKSSYQRYKQLYWLFTRVYLVKKDNAKTKRVSFNLLFTAFLNFCRNTNYHILRGPHKEDMTIDRKNNLQGYTEDNIQMLTSGDNCRKYRTVDIKLGKRLEPDWQLGDSGMGKRGMG